MVSITTIRRLFTCVTYNFQLFWTHAAEDTIKYQEPFTYLETFLKRTIKISNFSFSKYQNKKFLSF